MPAGSAHGGWSRRGLQRAFTLFELLIVIGIIVVLAGIGFTFTGPAREKARQTVCISNLHQIGLALQMYRTDWGGNDAARTPSEWGVPSTAWLGVLPYVGNSWAILQCPSVQPEWLEGMRDPAHPHEWSVYLLNAWPTRPAPQVPDWGAALAARGPAYPMLACDQHNHPRPDRPRSRQFVIVWRVMGNVEALYVPFPSGSWLW